MIKRHDAFFFFALCGVLSGGGLEFTHTLAGWKQQVDSSGRQSGWWAGDKEVWVGGGGGPIDKPSFLASLRRGRLYRSTLPAVFFLVLRIIFPRDADGGWQMGRWRRRDECVPSDVL